LIKVNRSSVLGPVGYTPSQIRNAYGLNEVSATGERETIAIVDAYGSPTIKSDLAAFCSTFGLPQGNLTITYPTGKPNTTDAGWALETSMDVEWAHTIAPNANILLCVAKSPYTNDLVTAIDYAASHGAQVVSNSWGASQQSNENSYDSHFQHPGVVYLASSGDDGSGVEWPSISPYVLAVGGTTLNIDSNGTYQSESGWSGSGGGRSSSVHIPSYQKNLENILGPHRGNPDVSWDADPNTGVAVYDTTPYGTQSGWFQVGGTSLGAPSWAGLVALFDQVHKNPLSSFDAISKLYNASNSAYSTDFNDVITGSNGAFSAQPGYDLVTGIGTPKANALVPYFSSSNK
jgi:subtilase family serine protease